MNEDRVKSGIQGFDELIEEGFPSGFCYAVIGGPGAGKTIFGTQFLYNGATQYGENGLYLTLEEPPYSIANNVARFGWNLYDLEKREKIALLDASPVKNSESRNVIKDRLGTEEFSVDGLLGVIAEAKRRLGAKRCVVDSLKAFTMQYRDEFETRQQTLKLIKGLTELRLTTLLLTEASEERTDSQSFGTVEFLAQGVIYLHTYHLRDSVVRSLEIRKMRGVRTINRLCPYEINDLGLVVYPGEKVFH